MIKKAIVVASLVMLAGCADSESKSQVTFPDWKPKTHGDTKINRVVEDNDGNGGSTSTHTTIVKVIRPGKPGDPPVDPPNDGGDGNGKPPKECDGHHQGGGNDHKDCGKDGKK